MTNKSVFREVLGASLVSGFLGALAALYLFPIPTANQDLIVFMLGQLSGFAGGVVAYHYGTSAGSVRKTEMLSQRDQDQEAGS